MNFLRLFFFLLLTLPVLAWADADKLADLDESIRQSFGYAGRLFGKDRQANLSIQLSQRSRLCKTAPAACFKKVFWLPTACVDGGEHRISMDDWKIFLEPADTEAKLKQAFAQIKACAPNPVLSQLQGALASVAQARLAHPSSAEVIARWVAETWKKVPKEYEASLSTVTSFIEKELKLIPVLAGALERIAMASSEWVKSNGGEGIPPLNLKNWMTQARSVMVLTGNTYNFAKVLDAIKADVSEGELNWILTNEGMRIMASRRDGNKQSAAAVLEKYKGLAADSSSAKVLLFKHAILAFEEGRHKDAENGFNTLLASGLETRPLWMETWANFFMARTKILLDKLPEAKANFGRFQVALAKGPVAPIDKVIGNFGQSQLFLEDGNPDGSRKVLAEAQSVIDKNYIGTVEFAAWVKVYQVIAAGTAKDAADVEAKGKALNSVLAGLPDYKALATIVPAVKNAAKGAYNPADLSQLRGLFGDRHFTVLEFERNLKRISDGAPKK